MSLLDMFKKHNKNKESADQSPRSAANTFRPIRGRVVAGEANDRYSQYPSNGLTPRRLAQIFREADEGNVRRQMELFEEIEEKDPHLFSQMQTRKLAVTGLDWEVQPFSESDQDKEISEFISQQLMGIENFDTILIDMLDALGKGIAILEIDWGVNASGNNFIQDIEYVHPKKLIWDSLTDELKVCTRDSPFGITFPENKFVIHKYKARSGHTSRAGILRVVAWMYLFKNYDVKDWVAFCEVFGMPLRLGMYDVSASEDDKTQLMEAIISLGTDAAGMVPKNTEIKFIESQKTTSVEIYERLARYCDEQVSKAILGQTLTSDSGGGSFAQSKTHNEVRHDLTVADAKALAVTIRQDIIRPLVEFNFGQGCNIPLFTFDCKEAEDQKENMAIYRTLVCEMGLEIPKSHIYQKFNIPKPEEGEDILNPQMIRSVIPTDQQELSLKGTDGADEMNQIDQMTAIASKRAEPMYQEMLKPLLNIVDKSKSIEDLQMSLMDEKTLKTLYQELQNPDFEDLLAEGLYLSQLVGRVME